MKALQVLSALSQSTRLAVFQHLVNALPGGMAAGDLAQATGTSPSTMSAHLAILSRAGIIRSKRAGRAIIYKAVTPKVAEVSEFLANVCVRSSHSEK